ncbi:hypothetical protein [Streptomyces naphthomycinicus]|uniref:hypothetical protein n=1 Tax=Streptomyces naphthomycinicus TaxID=2872625 RepID=UPI001CEC5A11|nr:hypothetical protein [Streptomyces sp. TML10]
MSEPLLLLGAGSAAGAEAHLAGIAAAHPVILVDAAAPAWARAHLVKHIAADLAHPSAVADAVGEYIARHDVRGVLSYVPEHLVTAARIAGRFRLPAAPAASLAVLGDRAALRRTLADVPGAGGLLAEEHLDGPAVSAETVVLPDGEIRVAALTRTAFGPPGSREATRHCVYAHDGLLHNPVIRQTVHRVVRAIDISFGVLRIGMKLTRLGPRITAVQAHLADDLIPLLVKRATGIDLPRTAAALAVGRTPDLTPVRQRAAAVHFAYPAVSGRIEHLEVAPEAACEPQLERMVLLQRPGNDVRAFPDATREDRLACWIALGPDAQDCHAALDAAAKHLGVAIAAPTLSDRAA